MIYLASPYSSPDKNLVQYRVEKTMQCTAALIRQKKFVWSPIVHCHEMATKFGLPTDAHFWMEYNFDFIRRSEEVYVLRLEGWDKSVGIKAELEVAHALFIPVRFVDEDGLRLDDWETPRS